MAGPEQVLPSMPCVTCSAPSAIPAASSLPVELYATVVTPTRAALGVVGLTTVFCRTLWVSQILSHDTRKQQHQIHYPPSVTPKGQRVPLVVHRQQTADTTAHTSPRTSSCHSHTSAHEHCPLKVLC